EKRASRTRSAVGRVPLPGGPGMKRPPRVPAMMRGISAPLDGVLGGPQTDRDRGGERGVRGQLGILADDGEGVLAGIPDQLRVPGQVQVTQGTATTGLRTVPTTLG